MPSYENEVRKVIGNYVKPDCTLATVEEIHEEFVGTRRDFTRWENAQEVFMDMDWDESSYEDFLRTTRDVVEEDIEHISESYLDILGPDNLSTDAVLETLLSNAPERETTPKEGFEARIREDDGDVFGTYYYFSNEVEITPELELEPIPNPKRVRFHVDPDRDLVTIKDTRPAKVQKLQSVLNEKTHMKVGVTGDLNSAEEHAEEIVRGFIESFPDKRDEVVSDE